MAQVTVELRHLLERTDFQLFDFDYEAEPEFKASIEKAMIDHYYFYEIGSETPERFKQRFETRFRRVISYYNELYKTSKIKYDPLNTYFWDEMHLGDTTRKDNESHSYENARDNKITDNTNEKIDNFNRDIDDHVRDDYPQNAGVGAGFDAERNFTTTSRTGDTIKKNTGDTTTREVSGNRGTKTNTHEGKNNYSKFIKGMNAPASELIALHRRNILRLTGAVLDEMRKCFILIY